MLEVHAKFFGGVQGVFFRATARDIAKRLQLAGTVRNVPDGSVELFAQGEREVLEKLLQELEQQFDITSKETKFSDPVHEFEDFRVVYHD